MHDSKIIKSTCGKLAAIAMSMLCMAALPSWAADLTVDSDWTLDADQVVDGTLTVNAGVTVTLNGHSLEVKGLAGSGTITGGVLPLGFKVLDYADFTGGQRVDSGVMAKTSDGSSVKVEASVTPMDEGREPYNSIFSM